MEQEGAILLIEDDYIDIMDLQRTFKKLNINRTIYVAHNGREALDKLHGKHAEKLNPFPSIIFLDLNMPKMNGIEFLRILRSDPEIKDIKIYILTTSNEITDKAAAEELGVSGYIIKPFFKHTTEGLQF